MLTRTEVIALRKRILELSQELDMLAQFPDKEAEDLEALREFRALVDDLDRLSSVAGALASDRVMDKIIGSVPSLIDPTTGKYRE